LKAIVKIKFKKKKIAKRKKPLQKVTKKKWVSYPIREKGFDVRHILPPSEFLEHIPRHNGL
jgi:hypothetical protein